ncbi:hypothetical protein [Beutenbergia cavernae]|uniref:hypothetical protein n=1 Tax=Beutenbergia cavernae TaxID=84757 RepID=UPI00019AD5F0|nr:hypothetical protein [Beutenbergia cavernae]
MLFETRFADGVRSGAVTVTFRRWRRVQAVAGHRYRTAVGRIVVDDVGVVDVTRIGDDDARLAGYADAPELVADLRGAPDLPVYRVAFHADPEPDERDVLAASDGLTDADVAEIDRRLDRLDRASSHGPWTRQTLTLIAAHPARRAPDLAAMLGRERDPFKVDVRKLKNLGLTLSLEVGYRLSPRGKAYLRSTRV